MVSNQSQMSYQYDTKIDITISLLSQPPLPIADGLLNNSDRQKRVVLMLQSVVEVFDDSTFWIYEA